MKQRRASGKCNSDDEQVSCPQTAMPMNDDQEESSSSLVTTTSPRHHLRRLFSRCGNMYRLLMQQQQQQQQQHQQQSKQGPPTNHACLGRTWFLSMLMVAGALWRALRFAPNHAAPPRHVDKDRQHDVSVRFLLPVWNPEQNEYSLTWRMPDLSPMSATEAATPTTRAVESSRDGVMVVNDSDQDDDVVNNSTCITPDFAQHPVPTCNLVHELYLSNAHTLLTTTYRYVSAVDHQVIFKTSALLRWSDTSTVALVRRFHMEHVMAARYGHDPHFVRTFGTCGVAVLNENLSSSSLPPDHGGGGGTVTMYAVATPRYHHRGMPVVPYENGGPLCWNDLSPRAKLVLCYQMAVPVATLHANFIVHDDLHPGQYLLTRDPDQIEDLLKSQRRLQDTPVLLKLSDFDSAWALQQRIQPDNDGQPLQHDDTPPPQHYCGHVSPVVDNDWRAPEHYRHVPASLPGDTYTHCLNMYAVLTGTFNFVDTLDDAHVAARVRRGETPVIPPALRTRSREEADLARTIETCWTYEPPQRSTMHSIVAQLQAAMQESDDRLLQQQQPQRDNS